MSRRCKSPRSSFFCYSQFCHHIKSDLQVARISMVWVFVLITVSDSNTNCPDRCNAERQVGIELSKSAQRPDIFDKVVAIYSMADQKVPSPEVVNSSCSCLLCDFWTQFRSKESSRATSSRVPRQVVLRRKRNNHLLVRS